MKRVSFTQQVADYFQAHPEKWIPATELERVGGRQAWRSRVSDVRQWFLAARIGAIENRQRRMKPTSWGTGGYTLSEYRFVPWAGRRSVEDATGFSLQP